jgi:hypothetical protein
MLRGKPRKSSSIHIGDKLIIAFTVLFFIATPYLSYKMIEFKMNDDIKPLPDHEVRKNKPRPLPLVAVGQVGILTAAQVVMVMWCWLLIQNRNRRPKTGRCA